MAEEDENVTFETTSSGASHTYPTAAGELRKGSHLMIKGHPCKVTEVTSSKTGKHGHAKCHIVALDIFTSKKYEDLCPASHNIDVPFVKNTQYQCLTVDVDSGEVSLLREDGSTKDDLNLPDRVSVGEPTEDDVKVSKELVEETEKCEKDVCAIVLEACGVEKIIAIKLVDQKK